MGKRTPVHMPPQKVEMYGFDEKDKSFTPVELKDGAIPVYIVGGGGMEFLVGEDAPPEEEGKPGDLYLNEKSGELYKKTEDGWGDPLVAVVTQDKYEQLEKRLDALEGAKK